jgi:hypothetical protein
VCSVEQLDAAPRGAPTTSVAQSAARSAPSREGISYSLLRDLPLPTLEIGARVRSERRG